MSETEVKSMEVLTSENKSPKKAPAVKKSAFEIQKEKDLRKVKGRFEFTELASKDAALEFAYGSIYEDVPIFKYSIREGTALRNGQVYEIPYCVARHLNETGKYPVNQYMLDENNKPSQKIGTWVRRYGFFPVDFEDIGQHESTLVTVQNV